MKIQSELFHTTQQWQTHEIGCLFGILMKIVAAFLIAKSKHRIVYVKFSERSLEKAFKYVANPRKLHLKLEERTVGCELN